MSENIPAANDAATVNLGEGWAIPSSAQARELFANCNWYVELRNNRRWYIFISKINGRVIEFCAGSVWAESKPTTFSTFICWTRSYETATAAFRMRSATNGPLVDDTPRWQGLNLRPVYMPGQSRGGGDDRHDVPEDEDKKIEPEPKPEPDEEKKTVKKSRKKSAS